MPEIANVEMAKAWDGEEGERWARHADRYERAARRYWQHFLDRDFVSASDRVLDIGCGNGKSSRDLGRLAPSGSVLGVDLSSRMLQHARERSSEEGLTNVRFEQGDVQIHDFETGAFDLAVSSFGAMFFDDPVAAFSNVAGALRHGGRLVLLTWREFAANEWLSVIRDALAVGRSFPDPPSGHPGPFGLADPEEVKRILGEAGFAEIGLDPVDEPIELGTDVEDAFQFVSTMGIVGGLTQDLDEEGRARALETVRTALADHCTQDGVLLSGAAWLITATTTE